MIPRYRTWVFHGMKVCWKQNGAGMTGQHLVNNITSVLWMWTRSFHLVKYRSSTDVALVSQLTMMSVCQDCARIAFGPFGLYICPSYSSSYLIISATIVSRF